MTHEHVSSLVTDLVHMAEATKRLPEIQRELDEARRRTFEDGERIARLELRLRDMQDERDALQAKLRSVEAERDDAGFRQLEAEDKIAHLRSVAESFVSDLGNAFAALSGDGKGKYIRMSQGEVNELAEWSEAKARAKAEAEEAERRRQEEAAKPEPVYPAPDEGQCEPDPTVLSQSSSLSPNAPSPVVETSVDAAPKTTVETPAEVASSPDPIVSTEVQSEPVNVTSAKSSDGAPISGPSPEGKYSGKLYRDWPYYVSEASWVENGGTHESYWLGRQGFRAAN